MKANPSRFVSANLPVNKFKNRLVNILPCKCSSGKGLCECGEKRHCNLGSCDSQFTHFQHIDTLSICIITVFLVKFLKLLNGVIILLCKSLIH